MEQLIPLVTHYSMNIEIRSRTVSEVRLGKRYIKGDWDKIKQTNVTRVVMDKVFLLKLTPRVQ